MNTRMAILVAILAASLVLLVAVVRWQPGETEQARPATGLKVVVIGVDGMDWFVLARMLEAQAVPSIAGLRTRGMTGEVTADLPVRPQNGWAVLGGGRPLTDEQLTRATDGRLYGLAPELARLVVEAGGSAVTVGWPASWPAGSGAGTAAAPFAPVARVHEASLPPALLKEGPGQATSEELAAMIDAMIDRNEQALDDEFRRQIFDGPVEEEWLAHMTVARWAFLSDLVTADIAAALMADEEPDLTLVCLGGLDAIGHRFLAAGMPDFFPEGPASTERYAGVLPNYYEFIDDTIERLRRLGDERTMFVVCSAYGTHPSGDTPGYSGSHANGPPGVFLCTGPNLAQRQTPLSLTTLDLAPTVLALLGLDIPTDADGRVVLEVLPRGHVEEYPLSYAGAMGREPTEPSPADLSRIEQLAERRLEALSP